MKISKTLLPLAVSVALFSTTVSVQGAAIPVPNFSFETPNAGQPTGWTTSGGGTTGGVNTFNFGFTAAADGNQFHYLNLTGFGGPATNSTETNAGLIGSAQAGAYTLTVAGGRRNNDATTDGSYLIELLSGGSVIGSQSVIDPFNSYAADSWNDITAIAMLNPGDLAIGGDLVIRLSAIKGLGGNPLSQGQFDNVRLDFSPVPIPAAVWLFGSGLLGLIGVARRKKS